MRGGCKVVLVRAASFFCGAPLAFIIPSTLRTSGPLYRLEEDVKILFLDLNLPTFTALLRIVRRCFRL